MIHVARKQILKKILAEVLLSVDDFPALYNCYKHHSNYYGFGVYS